MSTVAAGSSLRLHLRNVGVSYGGVLALEHVSLEVRAGDVLAVLGPNGAGKSTLARCCCGLVPAAEGSIEFNGRDITSLSCEERRRQGLVYLPEGRGTFPSLTVKENLDVALAMVKRKERGARLGQVYEMFPTLKERQAQVAGSLSGGEQQMLSLSRALAAEAALVIVDEPSLGLAPLVIESVFLALGKLREMGATLVIIEQFVHRALGLASQAAILSKGRLTWTGPAALAAEAAEQAYLGADASS